MGVRKQVAFVDVKVVRGAEIAGGHYCALMKVKLKSQIRKENPGRRVSQQIRIDRQKDVEVRREYLAAVERKCEEARADRPGHQTLHREATLESEPDVVKEMSRGVRRLKERKVAKVCVVLSQGC